MCHDWPVTNAIVDLPIKMKENSKLSSSNSSSPLGAQNKDKGAALQMLLTQVKLHLRCRLATMHWCVLLNLSGNRWPNIHV